MNMDKEKKRIKKNIKNEGNPGKKGLKNCLHKSSSTPLGRSNIYIIYKYHDKLIVAKLFF